ncbi:MAG: PTS sugar transporter subunit IIB [Deltaproteobacteria bacterium]|nr:PTS sugar transporter subunit IIB [Deltaproteobacteria bacterium]
MDTHQHVRIDNRLLHGQVVQFWIPHLEIDHLVIADDDVAANPAMLAVYRMALPERVDLEVVPIAELPTGMERAVGRSTMVLISDVEDAQRARALGFEFVRLTLGNVHSLPSRERVTDSVFLSRDEVAALSAMCEHGVVIEIQTFPGETLRLEPGDRGESTWVKH